MANAKKPTRKPIKGLAPVMDEQTLDDIRKDNPLFEQPNFVRNEDDKDWDYEPEGDLEFPPDMVKWFKEQGFSLRWARYVLEGKYDTRNINKNKRKGYEFVRKEELPEKYQDKYETSSVDNMREFVVVNDVVLMKVLNWKRDIVAKKRNDRAEHQLRVADELLRRNVDSGGGALELIQETKTTVTGGGQREVVFSGRKQATDE